MKVRSWSKRHTFQSALHMLSADHLNIDGPPFSVKCVRKFRSALGGEVGKCVCVCVFIFVFKDLRNEKRDQPQPPSPSEKSVRLLVISFRNITKKLKLCIRNECGKKLRPIDWYGGGEGGK